MKYFAIDANLTVLFRILPIASAIYKKNGNKSIFAITRRTLGDLFVDELMYSQKFVETIIIVDSLNQLSENDNNCIVFDEIPDGNITAHYASKFSLDIDADFVLNINSDFNYQSTDLCTVKDLRGVFPNFNVIDEENNVLTILRTFAKAKERHVTDSYIAHLLDLARIRFYLYIIHSGDKNISYYFWDNFPEAKTLDIRKIQDNKVISCYNLIYFF